MKKLSHETRQQHPEVDWRKISGFRDVVAHEYFGIDQAILCLLGAVETAVRMWVMLR